MASFDQIEARHKAVSLFGAPFALCAALLAFFISPTLRFFDPFALYIAGGFLAIGLLGFWAGAVVLDDPLGNRLMLACGALIVLDLLVFMGTAAAIIQPIAARTDVQCQILEEDMLRLRPHRSDSRELFQALGCRPQGYATLKLPAEHYIQYPGAVASKR